MTADGIENAPRVQEGRLGDRRERVGDQRFSAALVVTGAEFASAKGLTPLARITQYATGGCAPEWVMMAPSARSRSARRRPA